MSTTAQGEIMRITPTVFHPNSSPNFNGISILTRTEKLVDENKKLDITNKYYDYYSFEDETPLHIEDGQKCIQNKSELQPPEDTENGLTKCVNYIIGNTKKLPLTCKQFHMFRQMGYSDKAILENLSANKDKTK